MILVGIATIVQIFFGGDETAIIASIGDASLRYGLRPALVPSAAAADAAVVLPVPVVANPPVVSVVGRRPVAVTVLIESVPPEGVRGIALTEVHVSVKIYLWPTVGLVVEDAAIPSIVLARDWPFEVCRLEIVPRSARLLHRIGTRSVLQQHGPRAAAVVVFDSGLVVEKGRAGVISTLLVIFGPSDVGGCKGKAQVNDRGPNAEGEEGG